MVRTITRGPPCVKAPGRAPAGAVQ
jgi:hypothetical protein